MKPWIAIGIVFAVFAAVLVAGRMFGDGDWDRHNAQVITTQSGETVVIERDGWGGPPFGLVFVPLLIIGAFWAFGGRRGRGWGPDGSGPGDRSQWLSDWHKAEHERMIGGSAPGPTPPAA